TEVVLIGFLQHLRSCNMVLSALCRRLIPQISASHRNVQRHRNRPGARFRPHLEALEDRCLLSGDAVLRWNALTLEANAVDHGLLGAHEQGGPTRTARAFAIVHAAIFDAVNSIDHSYQPYLMEVPNVPSTASIDAAVAGAAHDTLAALYPSQKATF